MKKVLKIISAIIGGFLGLFVLASVVMAFLKICPPKGLWPTPPWCANSSGGKFSPDLSKKSPPQFGYLDSMGCFPQNCDLPSGMKELCQAYSRQEINWPKNCQEMPGSACQKLCETEKAKAFLVFAPQTLTYLSDNYTKTDKALIMGVGLHDIWGNVCYAKYLWQGCEDSAENVDSSFLRIKAIGGQLAMITDFSILHNDLTISRPNPRSGAHEISADELNKISNVANGEKIKLMLITNLYDGDDGARNKINYQTASSADIEKLFSGWKSIIVDEAKKAQQAKVSYFIINPRDIQLDYFDNHKSLLNEKYTEIISEVKKHYQGKICFWGNLWTLTDSKFTFMKDVDCVIEDWGINNILKNVDEDPVAIEKAWSSHLGRSEFGQFSGKEVFILVLMPSYDGAMQKGWIEPGIGYSAGIYTRDWREQALVYEGLFRALYGNRVKHVDGIISYGYWWTDTIHPDEKMANGLGHSIRGKDAEQVLYYWSNIFNQK